MTDFMEDTIREGIRGGVIREVNCRMLAMLLAAVAEGMLQLKKLGLFNHLKKSKTPISEKLWPISSGGIQSDTARS